MSPERPPQQFPFPWPPAHAHAAAQVWPAQGWQAPPQWPGLPPQGPAVDVHGYSPAELRTILLACGRPALDPDLSYVPRFWIEWAEYRKKTVAESRIFLRGYLNSERSWPPALRPSVVTKGSASSFRHATTLPTKFDAS